MTKWTATRVGLAAWFAIFPASAAFAANNVIFVTSDTGTGSLSTWLHANAKTGLAAADAVCQFEADNAGLGPGTFRAWLSDSSNDAYCRVSGFGGKVSANCGQASLPTDAGPWVRTDGKPFSPTLDELTAGPGVVYEPVLLDQHHDPAPLIYFTATHRDGTYDAGHGDCLDWGTGSNLQLASGGYADQTTQSWTAGVFLACNQSLSLVCMQTGAGPALPPYLAQGVPAFLTDSMLGGDLGSWSEASGQTGLAAGDAICETEAAANHVWGGGHYRAWLASSGNDATDRITGNGPWVRFDGIEVAASRSELISGTLEAPINFEPSGTYESNAGAWTGSDASGLETADTCGDWTDTGQQGRTGLVNRSSSGWAGGPGASSCGLTLAHLYCLCDQTLIFGDGLERGDLTGWTKHLP